MSESEAQPQLDESPGFLIRRLQQLAVSVFVQSLDDFGLTPIQYTILRVIRGRPGLDQTGIARQAVLDTSTVKDVLSRLEARGLIERRAGATDRRTRQTYLTSEGEGTLDAAEPHVESSRRTLLAPLSPEEGAHLLGSIRRLLEAHDAAGGSKQQKPWRRRSAPARPANPD